jgi:hypothetical protein
MKHKKPIEIQPYYIDTLIFSMQCTIWLHFVIDVDENWQQSYYYAGVWRVVVFYSRPCSGDLPYI